MTNQEERYQAWAEASFKTFVEGDVDAQVSLWAEDCTHTAIDAFGQHATRRGKAAVREAAEGWASGMHRPRLLKNELLSASEERGIGNAVLRWSGSDGKEWACNFIYMITLDQAGRCVTYMEWNVVESREKLPPSQLQKSITEGERS